MIRAVLATVQRRLERRDGRPASQSEALDAICEHVCEVRSAWCGPLSAREHRTFARDGGRCTAPGCTSYWNLHAHHLRFRSAGGGDALENLTTLSAWHHLRGVHARRSGCASPRPSAPGSRGTPCLAESSP